MISSSYPTNLYAPVHQDVKRYTEVSYQDVLKFKMHITETPKQLKIITIHEKSSERPMPSAS